MYDDLVYHLDLCVLTYHLHSQTFIWPMDPYYEQVKKPKWEREGSDWIVTRRDLFMNEVRQRFKPPFTVDKARSMPLFHGPGSCIGDEGSGWASNELLDPIISDYSRIYPWRPSFTRPNRAREPWIVYRTPKEITDPIGQVHMARYATDAGPGPYKKGVQKTPKVTLDFIVKNPRTAVPLNDALYCFEGGTGAIGNAEDQKKYAAWSLMGFVLARTVSAAEVNASPPGTPPAPLPYDVHIAFRGSRSGQLRKLESLASEKGNPDWATDLDGITVIADAEISRYGSVCRGFATSVKTVLPTIMACLEQIDKDRAGQRPRTIYVTGHSLGGALACHFASAMLLGTTRYGPYSASSVMPTAVKTWPWRGLQLITFSAPVVGGRSFHQAFNRSLPSRRVWLDGDPVTQERRHYPVGLPYWLPKGKPGKKAAVVVSMDSHQPFQVRKNLIRDRRECGVDVSSIPQDEPWKVFKTCAEVLTSLNTNTGDLAGCLLGMTKGLEEYLNIIQSMSKQTAVERTLNDLLYKLDEAQRKRSTSGLLATWTKDKPQVAIAKAFDQKFSRLLELWVLMCVLENDSTRYPITSPELQPFTPFLEEKF